MTYEELLKREAFLMCAYVGRHRLWPVGPTKPTLRAAADIRMRFGDGGCRFPGSKQLYEAATLIEGWNADYQSQLERAKPKYEPGPVPGSMF